MPGQLAVFECSISLINALREPVDLNMQTTGSDIQTKAMGSEILLNGDLMQARQLLAPAGSCMHRSTHDIVIWS